MRGAVLLALMVCVGRAAEVCTGAPVVETVQLPGSPFKLAVSSDGCWIYASMAGKQTGLAILKRSAGSLNVVKTLKTSGPLTGLVLTHDGKMLMGTASQSASLTSGKSVLFIDAAKGAVIHQFDEEAGDGKVYANVTADDKTLFVSNERAHSISVIDVPTRSVIGRIPVGNAPIALTFSPDEKWLYTTSQSATPDWAWPAVCDAENAASVGKHPKGAIVVVDVEIARKDPAHAVTSRVEAGCNPVRLALSPDGGRAYVTARKDNKVLVFETAKFSKIAEIEVGSAPVPIAVVDAGNTILVGNSNRFKAGGESKRESITIIDAATNRVRGNIPAGSFPRDIVESPDRQTLYIANFGSNTIDVRDHSRLPR